MRILLSLPGKNKAPTSVLFNFIVLINPFQVFNSDFMVKRAKLKPMPSEKFSEIMKPIFSNELHFNHLNGTVSLRKTDTDKGTQTELSMNKVLCPRCEDRDNLGNRFNFKVIDDFTVISKLTNYELKFNRCKESVMLGMESRIMNLIEKLLKKRKRNPFP